MNLNTRNLFAGGERRSHECAAVRPAGRSLCWSGNGFCRRLARPPVDARSCAQELSCHD